MSAKAAFAFQPAPRPQPRTSPEEVARLQAATEDLGFSRPLAPPLPPSGPATGGEGAAPATRLAAVSPQQPPATTPTSAPQAVAAPGRRTPALKFDVPDDLWDDLRLQALRRRVTVKFLVMEALAAKGYPVDLAAIPEDGRRIR